MAFTRHSFLRGPRRFALHALLAAAVAFCVHTPHADAGQATLSLSAPTTYTNGSAFTDFKGFKIYFGTTSGSYAQSVNAGTATSYTVNNLSEGSTYYFAATAYDSSGNESSYSTEVKKSIPVTQYTLSATATAGGTITPSGSGSVSQATSGTSTIYSVVVAPGATESFAMSPAAGYALADVKVDGVSVGAVTSYTFSNVSANHTLTATFSAQSFVISASAGSNGSISPSGSVSVNYGSSSTFTIAPATGYAISNVTVDGVAKGAISSYQFTNVTANHSISASFAAASFTITASSGTGGTISPAGTSPVASGGGITYTIAPSAGYRIADVKVDGTSVGATSSYSFSNVTANHSISASFTASSFTITASGGTGGTISPAGTSTVAYGGGITYTVAPSAGYQIADVKVDGTSVGAKSSYSFANVTANHTIAASFAQSTQSTLLANGGFELGSLSGWIDGGGITVTSAAAYSGSYGAKMATSGRIDQIFNTTVGATYYVSGRIRIDQQVVAPTWGGLVLQIYDTSWKKLAQSPNVNLASSPAGTWTQVKFSFVATTSQTRLIYQNFSNGQFAASGDDLIVSSTPIP